VTENRVLSYFEVDSRIALDPQPLIKLDERLVLKGMLLSLERGCALELSSTVLAEQPGAVNCHFPYLDRNIEIFEIRTRERVLVQELGRRWVRQRKCDTCWCWIPPTGPRHCLRHIFNFSDRR
jgi:hypothetical protein